jgi:hypothetical protein
MRGPIMRAMRIEELEFSRGLKSDEPQDKLHYMLIKLEPARSQLFSRVVSTTCAI